MKMPLRHIANKQRASHSLRTIEAQNTKTIYLIKKLGGLKTSAT